MNLVRWQAVPQDGCASEEIKRSEQTKIPAKPWLDWLKRDFSQSGTEWFKNLLAVICQLNTPKYKNLFSQARSSRFLYTGGSKILLKNFLTKEFDFDMGNLHYKKILVNLDNFYFINLTNYFFNKLYNNCYRGNST